MLFKNGRVHRPVVLAAFIVSVATLLAVYPWLITNALSSNYLPHGFCFLWNPRLLWLHVSADSAIFLSYVAISLTLTRLVYVGRRLIPFQGIFLAFGVFIIACGFSHLMDVIVLWKPLYWLGGDVKLVTAVASLITAVTLPFYLPQVMTVTRKAAQSAENERRFLAATDSSLDCFYILESVRDIDGEIADFRYLFVNPNGARLLRTAREKVMGQLLCASYPFIQTSGFFERCKGVVETGQPLVGETAIDDPAIEAAWLQYQVIRLGDGIAITASDVGRRKHAELDLEAARAFAQSLIDSAPSGIIAVDVNHVISAINPATATMLGYTPEELIGRATPLVFFDPVELQERAMKLSAAFGIHVSPDHQIFLMGMEKGIDHTGEWTFLRKDGSSFAVQLTVNPLRSPGREITGYMCTFFDISERKRREDYISYIAQHDALTGLPSRHLLLDRLDGMLARSRRCGLPCALLMIDLNRFTQINDLFGHQTGDKLLVQVAQRFRSVLREVDTVARMGGDEFVVLISDLDGPESALGVAAKLREELIPPFLLGEQASATIGASIGICMYPEGAHDAESLLRTADLAMYHAKASGGDQIEFFSEDIARLALRRQEVEVALREALRAEELELHYQPEIDLRSGEMVGVEALLRWHSRKLGGISPNDFIPVAEETGLIQPIGAWALQRACHDIAILNRQLGKPLFIAVNLSPRQLEQTDLFSIVEQALAQNGLAPESLEIEITESVLMGDSPKASQMLDALRSLGVRIAIDDFGAGFSSMSYLLRFSVDRLKIDRSFVRDCSTESNSSTVTTAIIALAHQLKLSVIAEGVETREQVDFLKAAGCDLVQGFYYSKAMTLDEIAAYRLPLAIAPADQAEIADLALDLTAIQKTG